MAAAAAGDERNLVLSRLATAHELALRSERDNAGMRRRESVKALRQHRVDGIDEFSHAFLPFTSDEPYSSFVLQNRTQAPREFVHQCVEFCVLLRASKIRQMQHYRSLARYLGQLP